MFNVVPSFWLNNFLLIQDLESVLDASEELRKSTKLKRILEVWRFMVKVLMLSLYFDYTSINAYQCFCCVAETYFIAGSNVSSLARVAFK